MPKPNENRYILDEKNKPQPCASPYDWAKWFQTAPNRIVGKDMVGDVEVSTIFIGLDPDPQEKPLIVLVGPKPKLMFETHVFGGEHSGLKARYDTWDAAKAGHADRVESMRKDLEMKSHVRAMSVEE